MSREDRAFSFLPLNYREPKPRSKGLTEIRGPYYSAMGKRYLKDVLETMGNHVDSLKFAGGSFTLMPSSKVKEMIDLAHSYQVSVSTGGFIERVLSLNNVDYVHKYMSECKELGFDVLEISSGFVTYPIEDWCALVQKTIDVGLKPKPELGIQFGAGGGSTSIEELEAEGTKDVSLLLEQGRKLLEAGAWQLMIESEGITENVRKWRTDVVARIMDNLGMNKCMFEAADPPVFEWYIKNFGPDVNLFVDHSQIVQLESLRSGTWGSKSLWGRILTYHDKRSHKSTEA